MGVGGSSPLSPTNKNATTKVVVFLLVNLRELKPPTPNRAREHNLLCKFVPAPKVAELVSA